MRRMRGEDRRTAIVKAALPLFAKRGFAETTTKEVARAAGVSEPLLYKHFPSKEALYLEIQQASCNTTDPFLQKMNEMEPSAETLVRLVYFLMRALVLGKPEGPVDWDIRHRLMVQSFLDDGSFARLIFKNRFESFCTKIEASLRAATAAGHAVKTSAHPRLRALLVQHMGAWLAVSELPSESVIDYGVSREDLLVHAVAFALRGMGMTDTALKKFYQPRKLASFFENL